MYNLHQYVQFNAKAWKQYQFYLFNDRKYVKAINKLINSINRDGYSKGLGKPEPLRYIDKYIQNGSVWSRRISKGWRLVYYVYDKGFEIISCRYHY